MDKNELLKRIEVNPRIMAGKPVIRGTRLSVQYIVSLLGQGETEDDIINEYQGLSRDDIRACLVYASEILDGTSFIPVDEAV